MQLREEQWEELKPMVIGRRAGARGNGKNSRQFINAMLFVIETKINWVELPREFGHWRTVHMRFRHWSETGEWKKLATSIDNNQELANMMQKIYLFSNSYAEKIRQKKDRHDQLIKSQFK